MKNILYCLFLFLSVTTFGQHAATRAVAGGHNTPKGTAQNTQQSTSLQNRSFQELTETPIPYIWRGKQVYKITWLPWGNVHQGDWYVIDTINNFQVVKVAKESCMYSIPQDMGLFLIITTLGCIFVLLVF